MKIPQGGYDPDQLVGRLGFYGPPDELPGPCETVSTAGQIKCIRILEQIREHGTGNAAFRIPVNRLLKGLKSGPVGLRGQITLIVVKP